MRACVWYCRRRKKDINELVYKQTTCVILRPEPGFLFCLLLGFHPRSRLQAAVASVEIIHLEK